MNAAPDSLPEEDTLFLACTRPAMVAGVTMEAMGLNVIFTSVLFIAAGSLLYALVGPVLHLTFQAVTRLDHNMFRVLLAWLETRGRSRTAPFWGGSTVTPLRLQRTFDARDLGHA